MKLPLYRSLRESYESSRQAPNPSLLFDRFVEWGNGWKAEGQHKQEFFKEIGKATTNGKLLEDYLQRQSRQVEALGGKILEATTTGRFVSGLGGAHPFEAGFVWHRTLGVPYLPGSSIKGALRAWTEQWSEEKEGEEKEAEIEYLFGDPGAGVLIVADALPTEPPKLEVDIINPHYGKYYRESAPPADYLSPIPVPFLAVAGRQDFRFALAPRKSGGEEAVERGAKLLKEALETIGAGAKTAVGYGGFTLDTSTQSAKPSEPGEDIPQSESELYQELYKASVKGKWREDKSAFSRAGVIEGWLERLEDNPVRDAVDLLDEIMRLHFAGVLANPDEMRGDRFRYKPRQRDFARRMLGLLEKIK